MIRGSDQIEEIRQYLGRKKVAALHGIAVDLGISERTVQRHLKSLSAITSFTHRRKFVTLPGTPKFDGNGLWFSRRIGFSNHGTSLDTILWLIEKSTTGMSRMELEAVLKISISKQIQILIERETTHRIKLDNQYLYIPESLVKNKRKKLKIVGDRQTEEHFKMGVKKTDLIALLKVVLVERKVGVDTESLKRLTKKYSLRLPLQKIQKLLIKYNLPEKKTPLP